MGVIVTLLIAIVCILLILIVLIQNPKGGGINSGFSAANQIMGVKQSTDMVEKLTWYFAAGLIFLCLISTPMLGGQQTQQKDDEIETVAPIKDLPSSGVEIPKPANP
ncbi:MAG: preprotein translocase subunit SecG [Bacteroidota bacterium]